MTEPNNNMVFVANANALAFYNNWKTDTMRGIYLFAPLSVMICVLWFTLIVGITIKLLFILLLPLILIVKAFVYTPLIVRGRYMNGLLSNLIIDNQIIKIKTFSWFRYKSIDVSMHSSLVILTPLKGDSFFKGNNVWMLEADNAGIKKLYVIEEFFETPIMSSLKKAIHN
ncbi:hypothetical protein [Mucilaginibacter sp. CSA2-8R]|uniref:hypothetical protein n=1 Tax=Mucilaginibacter sp. CSA2-8R TaxID=3141542 RepID=UPI00315D8C44